MASNSFIKDISQIVEKTPIETFDFPSSKPVWRGVVAKVGENLYKITNLQSSKVDLLDKSIILRRGEIFREVVFTAPENKTATGNEFRFICVNDDKLSGTFEVCEIEEFKLYKKSEWSALAETRYEEALIALAKLNWKRDPKGRLGDLLETAKYSTQYWEEVELNFLEQLKDPSFVPDIDVPAYNVRGELLTPDSIAQEVSDCKAIQLALEKVESIAAKRGWMTTISDSMYLLEMRQIQILFIKAALGISPSDRTIDSLDAETIQARWVEIKTLVQDAEPVEEAIEEAIEDGVVGLAEESAEKNTDSPGTVVAISSSELTEASESLLEPEELPTTILPASTSQP